MAKERGRLKHHPPRPSVAFRRVCARSPPS
jgi:hypothetical protein